MIIIQLPNVAVLVLADVELASEQEGVWCLVASWG